MPRGRPPGSKNRPKDGSAKAETKPKLTVVSSPAPAEARPGHNGTDLTEEQKRGLHFHHVAQYEKALAAKKKADADLRNVAKTIKADGGSVRAVKLSIQLKTPEGEAKFKEEREEDLRIARWNNLPIGVQGALFDEVDRRPIEERAYDQGFNDGASGIKLSVPATYEAPEAANGYTDGWKAGQASLGSKIKKGPSAAVLRSPEDVAKARAAAAADLDSASDDDDALSAGGDDDGTPPIAAKGS